MTREQILSIIEESNFQALLGKTENDFLDCKGIPYDLKNDAHKLELAKDVCIKKEVHVRSSYG